MKIRKTLAILLSVCLMISGIQIPAFADTSEKWGDRPKTNALI